MHENEYCHSEAQHFALLAYDDKADENMEEAKVKLMISPVVDFVIITVTLLSTLLIT